MLEQMRQNSRSLVIYTLFGILIAMFILSFGPQSGQQTSGCKAQKSYSVEVNGKAVTETSWRYAMSASGAQGNMSAERARQERVREKAIDKLIERELLAQGAEAAGIRINDDDLERNIAEEGLYILGSNIPAQLYYDDTGFNYDRLENIARSMGLSGVPALKEEQRRELLAQAMRRLIMAGVKASPQEVEDAYKRENSSVSVEFVKFSALEAQAELAPSEADIDAFLKDHAAEVQTRFDRDKALYVGGGPWVKLRLISVPADAPPAPVKEGEPPPPDAGLAKAQAALSRLKAKEDFGAVAKAVSSDARLAKHGGLTEWRRTSSFVGWGQAAADALGKLKKGELSDVIKTDTGYVIVRLEDKIDSDPTEEQIKRDLAWDLALESMAKGAARKQAEEALAKAKAGTDLAAQFPADGQQKIKVAQSGALKRRGDAVGNDTVYLGNSKALADAVFNGVKEGELAPEVYEVEDGVIVFKVVEKKKFDEAEFQKVKLDRASDLAKERASRLVTAWLQDQCVSTLAAGKISVNEVFVDYGVLDKATGQKLKPSYKPCASYGASPELELGPGGAIDLGSLPPGTIPDLGELPDPGLPGEPVPQPAPAPAPAPAP